MAANPQLTNVAAGGPQDSILGLQELLRADKITRKEYRERRDTLTKQREFERTGKRPVGFWDRAAGGALGATSGGYYGLRAGGGPGMALGAGIGGALGAAVPPQSLADVAMDVAPLPELAQQAKRIPGVGPLISKAGTKFSKFLEGAGGMKRAGARAGQGALEGVGQQAVYGATSAAEQGRVPTMSDLMPPSLWSAAAPVMGAGARAVPEVMAARPFRTAPAEQSRRAAPQMGVDPNQMERLPFETKTTALTPETQAGLRKQQPNAAELKEQKAANAAQKGKLEAERDRVKQQAEVLTKEAALETKEAAAAYKSEQLLLSGKTKHTEQELQRVGSQISGLQSTAGETKKFRVNDYVRRDKEITRVQEKIEENARQLVELEKEISIPGKTRQRELGAQSIADVPEGQLEYLQELGTPRSAAAVTPQGTGVPTPPYTEHPTRFTERMGLIKGDMEVSVSKEVLKAERAVLEKELADATAAAIQTAQEKNITVNNPAVQRALKERAALRGTRTKQGRVGTKLSQAEVELGVEGARVEHKIKYKSPLADRYRNLTEELVDVRASGDDLAQRLTALDNSKNANVRNFAWASSADDRWNMVNNKTDGFALTREVYESLDAAGQTHFKTWYYEKLAQSLYDNQRRTFSNAAKVFGEAGTMDGRTLALMTGGVESADDFIKIFNKIESGTQSVWDNTLVKKSLNHLAYIAPMAIIFFPEHALMGAATSGAILAATSWPKMFNAMAKDTKLRREFLQLMDDGGGAISARLYPRLAKYIYEEAHAVGGEKEEAAAAKKQ